MGDATQVMAATNLIGNRVKTPDGEDYAKIEELVIDPETGRVVGAVLSSQDPTSHKTRLSAIPWGAVTVSILDGNIYVDPAAIEHPYTREKDWDGLSEPISTKNVIVYTSSIYKRIDGQKAPNGWLVR
jgi:sporulation protein YlmC with PRC-barrel domain